MELKLTSASLALFAALSLCAKEGFAAPTFYSTSDPSRWQVATHVGGTDGLFSSFYTTGFTNAVAISGRPDWISNNSSGTNGSIGTWTFFTFRQTFDLTGYDPTSANLQFQWAADDSGEVFSWRGSWVPKFSLNGGSLVPWGSGPTYNYGPIVTLSNGFVSGLNTLDFFVEGNGVTDGFALRTTSFTALAPVTEPETYAMLLAGLGLLSFTAKRRKQAA